MSLFKLPRVVRGTLIGLIAPLIWSSYALFASFLKNNMPQFQVLGLAYFLAWATLCIIDKSNKNAQPKESQPLKVWIVAFVGVCLYQFFYLGAFRLAPPEHAELINYLWPIFVLLGGQYLAGKKILIQHYISCVLCIFGLAVLLWQHGSFEWHYMSGYLLALGCVVSWAFYSLAMKHWKCNPNKVMGKVCLLGCLISSIIHLSFEQTVLPNSIDIIGLIFSGSGVIALAYICWEKGMEAGNTLVLSNVAYLVPILSILLLIAFGFAESSWHLYLASCLIGLGACSSFTDLLKKMMKRKPYNESLSKSGIALE